MKILILMFTTLLLTACFDSGSDSGGKAKVSLSLQPVLSGASQQGNTLPGSIFSGIQSRVAVTEDCSTLNNYPDYQASWGASGAPDNMTMYLKSIVLSTSESGSTATLFESVDPDGDEISIDNTNGGTVSLAALAAAIAANNEDDDIAVDGDTIEAEVSTGTFNQLTVTFRNEADITGCIEESWSETTNGSSGNSCDESNSEACNALAEGTYKVCTGAATDATTTDVITIFDLVNASGASAAASVTNQAQFSDYVDTTAVETQVNLNIRDSDDNFNPLADATFNLDIPTVSLGDGDSIDLTLAFDMNLLLKFEANTRYQRGGNDDGDFHPLGGIMDDLNDSKELDAAYFHTSYLPDVMAVYLGEPGTVEGYEVTSCYLFLDQNGDPDPNDVRTVESWMTMIFNNDDDLVTGITTPKDDAGMVIVKGSINKLDADFRPSVANSDDTFDLLFGEEAFSGAINNWERIAAVEGTNELPSSDIEQTTISQAAVANRIAPTWYYQRKL